MHTEKYDFLKIHRKTPICPLCPYEERFSSVATTPIKRVTAHSSVCLSEGSLYRAGVSSAGDVSSALPGLCEDE